MNHPDAPAPAGWRVVPEVAAARPVVSADGRTYSFRIRTGFRFSPPSNQAVTAETFRYTIERALSPRLGPQALAAAFASDIAGVDAYRAGRAPHVAGISAHGDTLTIKLEAPAADFPARMALPYFCAVPVRTPIVPNGLEEPIPSAGPYYLAEHIDEVVAVVKRNPNYPGPRPQRLDAIVFRRPNAKADAVSQIERGEADHLGEFDLLSASPLVANGAVADRYGPPHRAGSPRFFREPESSRSTTSRSMHSGRSSPTRACGGPSTSRSTGARSPTPTAGRPPITTSRPGCPATATRISTQAGARTSSEHVRSLAGAAGAQCSTSVTTPRTARNGRASSGGTWRRSGSRSSCECPPTPSRGPPAEGADMLLTRMSASFNRPYYQDPVTFLENVLAVPRSRTRLRQEVTADCFPTAACRRAGSVPSASKRKLERIRRLGGREREAAAGSLDLEIARAAPGAVLVSETFSQFFSARIGCQTFQPLYFGVDIAALCMREGG